MSSAKWRPFCIGLDVINRSNICFIIYVIARRTCMLRNDDLVTWKHFSHYWSFVKRQVSMMRSFDVCFVVKLIRDVEKKDVLPVIPDAMTLVWRLFNGCCNTSRENVSPFHNQEVVLILRVAKWLGTNFTNGSRGRDSNVALTWTLIIQ